MPERRPCRSGAATAPGGPPGDQRVEPVAAGRRSKPSASASRPRGTSSTYAASSSASTRADSTPAAASTRAARASTGEGALACRPFGRVLRRAGHDIIMKRRRCRRHAAGADRCGTRDGRSRVGWLDRVEDQVDALDARPGVCRRTAAPPRRADPGPGAAHAPDDPHTRADALVQRLSALINLGRTAEFTRTIEDGLRRRPRARRALSARPPQRARRARPRTTRARWTAASPTWSQAARALGAVEDPDRETAWGWHDLAMAYSYLELPRLRAGRDRAGPAGRARRRHPRGDLRGARHPAAQRGRARPQRRHRRLPAGAPRHRRRPRPVRPRRRAGRLRPSSLAAYGYALARRAALGERAELAARTSSRACCSAGGGDSAARPRHAPARRRSAWRSPTAGRSRR